MLREPGLNSDSRLLAVTTLAFDISILEIFLPLLAGANLVLANELESQDADSLKDLLNKHKINAMQATPASWRMLLNSGWQAASGFRALCGGEKLPRDLAAELLKQNVEVWNLYGPTEACVWTSCYRVMPAADNGLPEVFIGHPIANTQCHILDSSGRPLPIGTYGELYIGGAGLARGYRGDERQTGERFVLNSEGARLYRTGDLACWTRSGYLNYSARLDNQIKVRGFRIELEEIELQLRRHDSVRDCAVVLQEFGVDDQRLIAHIVYVDSDQPTNTELRKHLRKTLPDYMLPQQFNALESMPLSPAGKLNRKALSEPVQQHTGLGDVIPASTPTEEKLVALWQSALKREQVSIDSQFFDIGGHSLLALEVILGIDETLGVRFSPQDMWVNTLEQLAARIDASINSEHLVARTPDVSEDNSQDKKTPGIISRFLRKLKQPG
jgi:acyl-coenzyme A synthetase/AMP-(fatty) acid ligase/acyl carrier protein